MAWTEGDEVPDPPVRQETGCLLSILGWLIGSAFIIGGTLAVLYYTVRFVKWAWEQ